jgi:hypothetical protein
MFDLTTPNPAGVLPVEIIPILINTAMPAVGQATEANAPPPPNK